MWSNCSETKERYGDLHMIQVPILLADGFEEAEALVPADLLRRAGASVLLVSVSGEEFVTGSHGIRVGADCTIDQVDKASMSCLLLPGGARGTELLNASTKVRTLIRYAVENGVYVAAICAAPSILGEMELLDGRRFACYPGYEKEITEGIRTGKKVEHDDIFVTAEGMGVSFAFGFKLVELLFGSQRADELKEQTRFA